MIAYSMSDALDLATVYGDAVDVRGVQIGTIEYSKCTHPSEMVDRNISVCLGCGVYMGQTMSMESVSGYYHLSALNQRTRKRKGQNGTVIELEARESVSDAHERVKASISSRTTFTDLPDIDIEKFNCAEVPKQRCEKSTTAADVFHENVKHMLASLIASSKNAYLLSGSYVFYVEGEVAAPCPAMRNGSLDPCAVSDRAITFIDAAIRKVYEVRKSARRCKDFTILFLVAMVIHICAAHVKDGVLDVEEANACVELNRTSSKVSLSVHERISITRALQFSLGITGATLCRLCNESVTIASALV